MIIAIICSVGAAFFNAASAVIQRRVAGHPKMHELFRNHFIKRLLRNKLWLGGFGLQVVAFLLQATALRSGSLLLVEPLLTLDLVFLLLILHLQFGQRASLADWLAVLMVCGGLAGLILSANPQVGHQPLQARWWLLSAGLLVACLLGAIWIVRRTASSRWRAAIAGAAAGISFALVAIVTKALMRSLQHGWAALFLTWPVYALIGTGILALYMSQNAYGAGPVVISQPILELSEPLVSSALGVVLFGDSLNHTPLSLTFLAISALITVYGVWQLSRSENIRVTEA